MSRSSSARGALPVDSDEEEVDGAWANEHARGRGGPGAGGSDDEYYHQDDGLGGGGGGGGGGGSDDEDDEDHLPSFGREDVSEAILAELGDDDDEMEQFEISFPLPHERGRPRCPWKQLVFGLLLLVTGIVATCMAFYTLSIGHGATTALFVIGAIALVPGTWVTFSIVQAYRRVPGYSFDNVPMFQD